MSDLPTPFRVFQFRYDHSRVPEYAPLMNRPMVPLFTADQMRAYAQEAVRQERKAILAALEDLEEPAWYGYENPHNFDDGKRAAMAVVRSRSPGESAQTP